MYHLLAGSPLSPPVNYINEETRDDKRARRGGTTWKLITDNSLFFLRPACFGDNGRIRRNTSFSTNFLVITVKHGFEKFRSWRVSVFARSIGWMKMFEFSFWWVAGMEDCFNPSSSYNPFLGWLSLGGRYNRATSVFPREPLISTRFLQRMKRRKV